MLFFGTQPSKYIGGGYTPGLLYGGSFFGGAHPSSVSTNINYFSGKTKNTLVPGQNIPANSFAPEYSAPAQDAYMPAGKSGEVVGLERLLNDTLEKQGVVGKFWNGVKNLTGLGIGSKKCASYIEKYKNGQISYQDVYSKLNAYSSKQTSATSVISGVLAAALSAIVIPKGGLKPSAILAAVLTGASANAGIKTLDRATNGVQNDTFDAAQISKDCLTGAAIGGATGVLASLKGDKIKSLKNKNPNGTKPTPSGQTKGNSNNPKVNNPGAQNGGSPAASAKGGQNPTSGSGLNQTPGSSNPNPASSKPQNPSMQPNAGGTLQYIGPGDVEIMPPQHSAIFDTNNTKIINGQFREIPQETRLVPTGKPGPQNQPSVIKEPAQPKKAPYTPKPANEVKTPKVIYAGGSVSQPLALPDYSSATIQTTGNELDKKIISSLKPKELPAPAPKPIEFQSTSISNKTNAIGQKGTLNSEGLKPAASAASSGQAQHVLPPYSAIVKPAAEASIGQEAGEVVTSAHTRADALKENTINLINKTGETHASYQSRIEALKENTTNLINNANNTQANKKDSFIKSAVNKVKNFFGRNKNN